MISKPTIDPINAVLGAIAIALTVFGLWQTLHSGVDASQGYFIRLFMVHPPVAWVGMLGVIVACVYALGYLLTRKTHFDRVSAAAVEVATLFTVHMLATGMLWGKATWGTYWTWDPRITTSAIGLLILLGYGMVRGAIEDPDFKAKASAGIVILGSINVPITYLSVLWWRSVHQLPTFDLTGGNRPKAPFEFTAVMLINMLALTLLYCWFVRLKSQQLKRQAELELAQENAYA